MPMTYLGLFSGSKPVHVSTLQRDQKRQYRGVQALVARLGPQEMKCSHFAKIGLCLTTRETANGYARSVSLDHLLAALSSHFQVEPSLDDAEEVLLLGILVCGDASVKPAYGSFHGLLHAGVVGRGCLDDIVELHHDV